MKKRDVGMAKHFSKKYGSKGWAFDYPVSAIWNQFLVIACFDLLAPNPSISIFTSLFKCSLWRSQLMLCPGSPLVLTNLDHFSCSAGLGGKTIWYWVRNFSEKFTSFFVITHPNVLWEELCWWHFIEWIHSKVGHNCCEDVANNYYL